MSLKSIVKKYSPDFVLPALRASYHIAAWPCRTVKRCMTAHRALKYLPYYQDELSRGILADRIEYLKTGDASIFIRRAKKEGLKFSELSGIDGRSESSYGADSRKEYSDVVVVYDKEGSYLDYTRELMTMIYGADGFKCVSLDEFFRHARILKSSLIVPVIEGKTKPVSFREDIQYFDVFSPADDEIIVDAGAYDGTTAIQFLEWGGDKVKHIYSFEFDPVNAAKCEENLKPYADKVTLIKKGTWDKDEVICAEASGSTGSSVISEGNTEVQLASIDSELAGVPVTFIKMDVEGAELKSLIGAKNTIIKNRPRLAICVYHKPEDIYEIPGYILSLVPEYKFYLRHYASNEWETVLYAYCE